MKVRKGDKPWPWQPGQVFRIAAYHRRGENFKTESSRSYEQNMRNGIIRAQIMVSKKFKFGSPVYLHYFLN